MVLETNMLGYMSVGECHKKEGCGKKGWDETKAKNNFSRVGTCLSSASHPLHNPVEGAVARLVV